MVSTKISQLKKLQVLIHQLCISNALIVQPFTLVEDMPNDLHQTIAANIHRSPLHWWKEVRPHVNRRSRSMDNLQKISFGISVKHNIIPAIPNHQN
jgi:hypothetical protein